MLEFQSWDKLSPAGISTKVFTKGLLHGMTVAHHGVHPGICAHLAPVPEHSKALLPHHRCVPHTFLSPSSPTGIINKAQSYSNKAAVFSKKTNYLGTFFCVLSAS